MLTEIRISRSALVHNVRAFRKVIGAKVKFMAVVKSNAYGHGVGECARIIDQAGAEWFGVASVQEALALRKIIRTKPICVLSFIDVEDAALVDAMRKKIRLPAYTVPMLQRYERLARKTKTQARVHIKLDTGTTRIGFLPKDLHAVARMLKKFTYTTIEGVYSHFAEVESEQQKFSQLQHERFATLARKLEVSLGKRLLKHIDCSAGTLVHPDAHFDMVRIGMSMYGIHTVTNPHRVQRFLPDFRLHPVLRWYTKVVQVKHVPAGTSIGYNRTYITKRPTQVAVLPVGYWDGLDRRLSNRGVVYVGKYRAYVRGRVCMNLTMVEIPYRVNVPVGTVVELLGPKAPATVMATQCGTIPYEVLTRLNPLLPRRII